MFNYKRHWAYLKYLMRHKYYVFLASMPMGVSLWRALVHDLSKFRPSEWFPYAKTFYNEDGSSRYHPDDEFDRAWLHHQHCNKHHWQYWLLRQDSGTTIPIKMPRKYVSEMIADWMGAGRAITGKWEVAEWYEKNRHNIQLHPKTEDEVDSAISIAKYYKG